jgi:lipid-A-disaccharide synthase
MAGNILLIAGETSGDMLAAHLLKGLRAADCVLPVWGIGGPALLAQGMECVESIDALAVRGYAEVLGALPRLWHLRRTLMAQAASRLPSLCITVDAPDFNLAFAAKMKALGVPTLHFISPSIWAWRRERIAGIKAAVDHMVCVFPHEPALYHAAGIPATYVGYPLAQSIALQPSKEEARAVLGIAGEAPVIALLPGSRAAEIKYILPRLLDAAAQIYAQQANVQFIMPIASAALQGPVQALLAQQPENKPRLSIQTLLGKAGTVFAAADIGIIASGTATLEAALYKLPIVITYVMPRSSWAMMGHKNYLPWVGLPNILCNEWVVTEWLQDAATPENLSHAALTLLNDTAVQMRMKQRFTDLHHTLRRDTQALAARAVMRMLPTMPTQLDSSDG